MTGNVSGDKYIRIGTSHYYIDKNNPGAIAKKNSQGSIFDVKDNSKTTIDEINRAKDMAMRSLGFTAMKDGEAVISNDRLQDFVDSNKDGTISKKEARETLLEDADNYKVIGGRTNNKPQSTTNFDDKKENALLLYGDIDSKTGTIGIRQKDGTIKNPPSELEYALNNPADGRSDGTIYIKNSDGTFRDVDGANYTKNETTGEMKKDKSLGNYYETKFPTDTKDPKHNKDIQAQKAQAQKADKKLIKDNKKDVEYVFNAYRNLFNQKSNGLFTNTAEQKKELSGLIKELATPSNHWNGTSNAKNIFKYDIYGSTKDKNATGAGDQEVNPLEVSNALRTIK